MNFIKIFKKIEIYTMNGVYKKFLSLLPLMTVSTDKFVFHHSCQLFSDWGDLRGFENRMTTILI